MAEIVFDRVSKRFGGHTVVHDLSLTVHDRELLTLVGPSGCGKSTTLSMLAGLEDPSAGLISIEGQVVNAVPSGARDIAMVFQSYALYPHMTVRDNIGFGLKVRGLDRATIEARVAEAARMLDIQPLLDRKPKDLSGGQRQRVALGRALTRNPKAFLLDEPLSNLDAQLRTQMRAELKLLFDRIEGTVVYVTHDQAEAMTLSDRLVVMKDGEVQQIGAPLEVYNHPANLFVARFLGSPPINAVEGELTAGADGPLLRGDGFAIPLSGPLEAAAGRAPGTRAVLGVRPEDVTLSADGAGLTVRVDLVEPMGALNVVYASAGGARISATTPPSTMPEIGSRLVAAFDPAKARLFDAGGGASLSTPG